MSTIIKPPRRLLALSELPKRELALTIACLKLYVASRVLTPFLTSSLIDNIASVSAIQVAIYSAYYFLLTFGANILKSSLLYSSTKFGWSIASLLQEKMLNNYFAKNQDAKEPAGAFVDQLEGDVQAVASFAHEYITDGIANALLLICIFITLAWHSFGYAILFTIASIGILYWQRRQSPRLQARWKEFKNRGSSFQSMLANMFQARIEIHHCNGKHLIKQQLMEELETVKRHEQRAALDGVTSSSVVLVCTVFISALGIFLAYELCQKGAMTAGSLFLLISFIEMAREPLEYISDQLKKSERIKASLTRIKERLAITPETIQYKKPLFKKGPLSVAFHNVSYQYPSNQTITLHEVNFELAAGRNLAVIGASGTGKSTLLRLLKGFDQSYSGSILIGGIDIRTIAPQRLHKEIGFISQEPAFLQTSVRENIRLFNTTISDADIYQAAQALGCLSYLKQLPEGLDTPVAAHHFSSGALQLLSLIRVSLQKPSILVLDEPTASLDDKTEKHVVLRLKKLMQNKTILFITHTPQLLTMADEYLLVSRERGIQHLSKAAYAHMTSQMQSL